MKVLIDAFWWREGPVSNRQVLHRIVLEWIRSFPQDELILATREKDKATLALELGDVVQVVGLRLRPHGIAVVAELGLIAKRVSADAILAQNFTPLRGRTAVFIQDVLFLSNPDWFTRLEKAYFSLMPLTARNAVRVLSSSATEGRRMDSYLRKRHPSIPVGLAPNPELLDAEQVKPNLALERDNFILTVGRLNVRKNLERVCQAAIISPEVSVDRPLVVAGGYQGKSVKFSGAVQDAVKQGRVVLAGSVTDAELAWLYSNASAFVFASLDEGFGLPPVEALAFGTPVIASDITVMRENLADHAVYVDPRDVPAMSRAFAGVTRDDGNSATRIAYSTRRFSWPDVVARIRSAVVTVSEAPKGKL